MPPAKPHCRISPLIVSLAGLACLLGCHALEHRAERASKSDQPTGKWQAKFASTRQRLIQFQRPEKSAASHQRDWRTDLTVLPYAEIRSDRVRLYNIRDCQYRTELDYDVRHFDREIMLTCCCGRHAIFCRTNLRLGRISRQLA